MISSHKFIWLHLAVSKKEILVNVEAIGFVEMVLETTVVSFQGVEYCQYITVTETPKQILELIQGLCVMH